MLLQDLMIVHCSVDFYHKNKVLATSRMSLRQHGISGLSQTPCLRALLSRLALLLQEQHSYEKVCVR